MLERDIAVVAVRLPDKRYVFQRRDNKAPSWPGMLSFWGGAIEDNETPDEAAFRELHEETSLNVPKENLRIITNFKGTRKNKQVHVFLCDVEDSHFKVFEGAGLEIYELAAALDNWSDLTDITVIGSVYLLRQQEEGLI